MASHLRTELVLAALNMAIAQRRPDGVVHHSDKGAQYTSLAFGKRCLEMGVVTSTGSAGDCYDNAMAESFFATLGSLTATFHLSQSGGIARWCVASLAHDRRRVQETSGRGRTRSP